MSQVDIQFKANSTKTKLKQLLKNIDDGKPLLHILLGKSGFVKEDLFFQLLNLHGVTLSPEARTVIHNTHRKGDKINYQEALTVICIDLETAANDEQKWTVRKDGSKKGTANGSSFDTQSVRSAFSRAKSLNNHNAVNIKRNAVLAGEIKLEGIQEQQIVDEEATPAVAEWRREVRNQVQPLANDRRNPSFAQSEIKLPEYGQPSQSPKQMLAPFKTEILKDVNPTN